MQRKDGIDTFGAVSLIAFSLLLGVNQVVIKLVNDGLQPVFAAGLRSIGALVCIGLWLVLRRRRLVHVPGTVPAGFLIGILFAAEFLLLFNALDLTTVVRTSVIFYSMPLWAALGAHLLLPGDRITGKKAVGLVLSFAGVTWAMLDRPSGGQAGWAGDLAALGAALCWAGILLTARGTRLVQVAPEVQLLWQLVVSALVLTAAAPLFGPLIRDLAPVHLWGLAFQVIVVASAGFLFWLWLLTVYPASGVASFSFLAPVFGVLLGWLVLGEDVGPSILGALALVAAGLVLINRPPRPTPG